MIPKTFSVHPLRLLLLLAMSFSVSGCGLFFGDEGVFRNREADYLRSDDIEPLKLPEGYSGERLGELYPIPPMDADGFEHDLATDYEVPRPMPLSANINQEHVRIQSLGDERWIMLNVPPGDIWPRVRNFLTRNDLSIEQVDIDTGIMETEWLRFSDSPDTWDRYRLRIDQGVQPDTSEVHITHASVPEGSSPGENWSFPDSSADPEREAWLLEALAGELAEEVARGGGTSLVAQAIGGRTKSNLEMHRGEATLHLTLERNRALATLAHALRQDGFTTFEAHSGEGLFYIDYRAEQEEPGWFRRWFTSAAAEPETPYSLEELSELLPEDREALRDMPLTDRDSEQRLPDAPGYLVVVTGEDGDIRVRIRDPYGKRLRGQEARRLLTLVRRNLI